MKLGGLIAMMVPLAVAACDNKGSLGNVDDGGTFGAGSDEGSGSGLTDAGDVGDGGSATSTGGGGAGSDVDSGNADMGAGSDESGGTDGLVCADGSCAVSCLDTECGGTAAFDETGCARQSCSYGDDCGAGSRCYVGSLFGGCVSSASSCSFDDQGTCTCGGTADCGGGYCIPEESFPAGDPGPDGAVVVDNGCAPNDAPAVEILIGLDAAQCDASATPPTLDLLVWGLAAGETGTVEVGDSLSNVEGNGSYDDGSGPASVSLGTVTISDWSGGAVTGTYEVWIPAGTGEPFTHLTGDFSSAPYCDSAVVCG